MVSHISCVTKSVCAVQIQIFVRTEFKVQHFDSEDVFLERT